MSLAIETPEELDLRASVRRLLQDLLGKGDFDYGRPARLLDAWRGMAELGIFSYPMPGALDGLDGRAAGVLALLGESGAALAPRALIAGVSAIPRILRSCGNGDLARGYMSGEMRFAYAQVRYPGDTPPEDDRAGRIALDRQDGLSAPPPDATHWLIGIRPQDPSLSQVLCLDAAGLASRLRPVWLVDGTPAAGLLQLPAHILPGEILERGADAARILDDAEDWAAAAAVADALGAATAGFDLTREYLLQRHQFGRPLSSFQAIQHTMACAYAQLEQLRSMVMLCASCLDASAALRGYSIASARVYLASAGVSLLEKCIQVSGGVGVSDEYRLGHYYKRVLASCSLHGTTQAYRHTIDAGIRRQLKEEEQDEAYTP